MTTPAQLDRRIGTAGRKGVEKFALLFKANPFPMAVHGRDGRVADVNEAFLDTFLCLEEEIVGRRLTETAMLAAPADAGVFEEFLQADAPFADHALRMRRRDGALLDCLVSGKSILDRKRKFILTVFIDETKRKRALMNLEEDAAMYRFMADHRTDVVWMMDTNLQLIYVSPSNEKLLGFTPEELMQRTIEESFTRDSVEKSMQIFADGMQFEMAGLGSANRFWKLEMDAYHKNGRILPLEIVYFLQRDKDGVPKYLLAHVQAKTEKTLPPAPGENGGRAFCQREKEESLERMAGAIAHNFNNLLGVVQGNLELASLMLPESDPVENKIAEAMKATRRAAEISGLMLTYLGKTLDRLEPLDLSDACRRALPSLQNAYAEKVLLSADFPLPGPMIRANALHVERILTNLVANAVESCLDDRKIVEMSVTTVSAVDISPRRRFPAGWEPTEKFYACLKVRDEGVGVAEETIEKLFDPFFSSKFTGRGLGLPVVLGTVRAKSGCVTVESEPGKGSVFSVYLPIIVGEIPAKAHQTARPGEPTQPGAVLLVDDEQGVRRMGRAMLEHLGHTVIEAGDGFEALEVFRRNRHEIQCVISDLTMPRMDGWKFIEALRLIVPGMPVILASGYDQAQVMAGAGKELPQAFLGKPYGLKALQEAIRQAQEGSGSETT